MAKEEKRLKRLRVIEIEGKRKTFSFTEQELQTFLDNNPNAIKVR